MPLTQAETITITSTMGSDVVTASDSIVSSTTAIDYDAVTVSDPYGDLSEYLGIDRFQSIDDLKRMCEQYPALKKSLEQFKITYNIVKDDWAAKLD